MTSFLDSYLLRYNKGNIVNKFYGSAGKRTWTPVGTEPLGPKPSPFDHSGIPAWNIEILKV